MLPDFSFFPKKTSEPEESRSLSSLPQGHPEWFLNSKALSEALPLPPKPMVAEPWKQELSLLDWGKLD